MVAAQLDKYSNTDIQLLPPHPPKEHRLGTECGSSHNSAEWLARVKNGTLAIAMTTAPRRHPTLETCLKSLRLGGFLQEVHLFTEPDTVPNDWQGDNVIVHQNQKRLGCYPNWLQSAQWLLIATDAPFLMICEDDGIYCRGAANALYHGLSNHENSGCLSLYTPMQNYYAGKHTEKGWFRLQSPERWGTVAQVFPRPILRKLLRTADWSQPDGTDRHIEAFLTRQGMHWYSHAPSLVDHVGDESTLGHESGPENAGIGFDEEFTGYPEFSFREELRSTPPSQHKPLVSIILPVYNGASFLKESIESCFAQTYTNWELIVVDDGSSDSTRKIIECYRDPRLTSIRHSTNRQLPAALNTGFRQSRGELLTWTSHDNRYLPNALETMVQFLERDQQCDMVFTDFHFIDSLGNRKNLFHAGPIKMLPAGNVIGACFLYRRCVYCTVGEYNEDAFLAEDYEYWLRVEKHFCLKPLAVPLYEYRQHSETLTARYQSRISTIAMAVRSKNRE